MMADTVQFSDLVASVRRFSQRSLLKQLAQISLAMYTENHLTIPVTRSKSAVIAPHALGRIAALSVRYGSPYASKPATTHDAMHLSSQVIHLDDPLDHGSSTEEVTAWLLRTAWDQFPLQGTPQSSFSVWYGIYRSAMTGGDADYLQSLWHNTVHVNLKQWFRGSLTLWLAFPMKGRSYMTMGELRQWTRHLSYSDDVMAVVKGLSSNPARFRELYDTAPSPEEGRERYCFNPLAVRPIIELSPKSYICPVPRFFGNAVGLATVYRLSENDDQFLSKFGRYFEAFVGELLVSTIECVWPEHPYRVQGQEWRGFDWVAVLPGCALAIECRTGRLTLPSKITGDVTFARESFQKRLSGTIEKFPSKIAHMRAGLTDIDPSTLPDTVHRMVVTSEPFLVDNQYLRICGLDPFSLEAPIIIDVETLAALLCNDPGGITEILGRYKREARERDSGSFAVWYANSGSKNNWSVREHPLIAGIAEELLRGGDAPSISLA